jgi:hypothetical protein
MADLPGLTRRAADALKPFMDQALRLEREGYLDKPAAGHAIGFTTSEWRELLAAFRESQALAEGVCDWTWFV